MTQTNEVDEAARAFAPLLSGASLLIVDDEPGMRNFLIKVLKPHCMHIDQAATAEEASRKLDCTRYDVVVLDNVMPGQSGVDWLQEQREVGFFSDAVLITAYAELESVIAALRAGAVDFLLKPFRSDQILNAVARCMDRSTLRRENALLRHQLGEGSDMLRHRDHLAGTSPQIQEVRDTVRRIAQVPSNVLISGETGTGKEVAARMLHALSDRADKPFIAITCGSRTDEMFEEELFGQVSPVTEHQREGLLLAAQGGTFFLDEVANLSPHAQLSLLRVIDEARVRPIGAQRDIPLDVRFVFSSTQPLLPLVERKLFREDLFYRIDVLQIALPALRERPEDILELASLFASLLAKDFGVDPPVITPSVRARLLRYHWPGNVRELRNHLERALIHGDLIETISLVPDAENNTADTLASVQRHHILKVLESVAGNRAMAARLLGISRKTIDRKCQSWGI